MVIAQILLNVISDGEEGYTIDMQTSVQDNDVIKKLLRETLELMDKQPDSKQDVEIYKND